MAGWRDAEIGADVVLARRSSLKGRRISSSRAGTRIVARRFGIGLGRLVKAGCVAYWQLVKINKKSSKCKAD